MTFVGSGEQQDNCKSNTLLIQSLWRDTFCMCLISFQNTLQLSLSDTTLDSNVWRFISVNLTVVTVDMVYFHSKSKGWLKQDEVSIMQMYNANILFFILTGRTLLIGLTAL